MVGVHVDDIIVSGEEDLGDEFFSQLKQRFPVKTLGELKMYTGCAFERDWDKGIPRDELDGVREQHGSTVQHFRNLDHSGESRCRSWAKKRWRARG